MKLWVTMNADGKLELWEGKPVHDNWYRNTENFFTESSSRMNNLHVASLPEYMQKEWKLKPGDCFPLELIKSKK